MYHSRIFSRKRPWLRADGATEFESTHAVHAAQFSSSTGDIQHRRPLLSKISRPQLVLTGIQQSSYNAKYATNGRGLHEAAGPHARDDARTRADAGSVLQWGDGTAVIEENGRRKSELGGRENGGLAERALLSCSG